MAARNELLLAVRTKNDIHRLTFTHILHEFFHAFTHADKGIFHLLNGLVAKPGTMEREKVEGK
jgi:hypothetical protein